MGRLDSPTRFFPEWPASFFLLIYASTETTETGLSERHPFRIHVVRFNSFEGRTFILGGEGEEKLAISKIVLNFGQHYCEMAASNL